MSNTAKAAATPAVTAADVKAVIETAHKAVTVTGTERARALRTAAEKAVTAAYGPFTIVETVSLPEGQAFTAWISGAVGRNGFVVSGKMGKAIMGKTTIEAMIGHDAKSFTNADAFKIGAKSAKAKGSIVMSGLIG